MDFKDQLKTTDEKYFVSLYVVYLELIFNKYRHEYSGTIRKKYREAVSGTS